MSVNFVVVPQWQGSSSARALQLRDGAEAILGELPAAGTVLVDVPLGAGEELGTGVRRLTSLQAVRESTTRALKRLPGPAVVIGGDCGVDLAPVEHAAQKHPKMALVWLDAHGDLHTPNSSPSGAFHGMVLRTLLGDGCAELVPERPVPLEAVVLAGTRALDPAEEEWVAASGIQMLPAAGLDEASLLEAIEATGASAVYLHIDLDVLDPAAFGSLSHPEPFGLEVPALLGLIRAVLERFTLAGGAIVEFSPSDRDGDDGGADDLTAILRIIGALTAARPADDTVPSAGRAQPEA